MRVRARGKWKGKHFFPPLLVLLLVLLLLLVLMVGLVLLLSLLLHVHEQVRLRQ